MDNKQEYAEELYKRLINAMAEVMAPLDHARSCTDRGCDAGVGLDNEECWHDTTAALWGVTSAARGVEVRGGWRSVAFGVSDSTDEPTEFQMFFFSHPCCVLVGDLSFGQPENVCVEVMLSDMRETMLASESERELLRRWASNFQFVDVRP